MQISNNIQHPTLFKATKIASTYNYVRGTTCIDIFKLSSEDKNFLHKLSERILIKNLCPKLKASFQERWQKVFDYCIQEAKEKENQTYIAISNYTPCASLTYSNDGSKNNYLNGVCSIPNPKGKKVPLAGQTLIYQLFLDSYKELDKKGIVLEAIHNGPVNVVQKYEKMGFTKISEIEGVIRVRVI